jgi:hypothetical protein
MNNENLTVRQGVDFIRDNEWKPVAWDMSRALREARKRMPEDLRRCGFKPEVCYCGDWYRIGYGK